MIEWLKERATERNSKRAAGVLIAVAGYFGFINPEALTHAGAAVGAAGVAWLAVDAFLTQEAPKP
jgi:hypothetical protein